MIGRGGDLGFERRRVETSPGSTAVQVLNLSLLGKEPFSSV